MQPCLRFYAVLTVFVAVIASVALAQHSNSSWRFLGPEGGNITHIAASGDTLFAVGEQGRMFRTAVALVLCGSRDSTVFRSTDSGQTWQNSTIPFVPRSFSFVSNSRVLAISTNALWRSENAGISWQRTCDLPQNALVQALCPTKKGIVVAITQGVIHSEANTCVWRSYNQGLSLHRITNIVANDSAVFVLLPDVGGWHRLRNGVFETLLLPNGRTPAFLATTQTSFWSHAGDSILWRSLNGNEWLQMPFVNNTQATMSAITGQFGDRELIANVGSDIFFSANLGQSWRLLSGNSANVGYFSTIAVAGDTLWAAYRNSTVSTVNEGLVWKYLSMPGGSVSSAISRLQTHENKFYIEGGSCFNDDCQSWAVGIDEWLNYYSRWSGFIFVEGTEWSRFASRKSELVRARFRRPCLLEYKPTNTDWKRFPVFPNPATYTSSLGATNKNIFVGTNGGLYVLNAVATSVADNSEQKNASNIPQIRAFPNPASENVSVTIMLPVPSTLRLSLFDALGKEVVRLADDEAASGEMRYSFPSTAFPSGVYTLRLQAGARVQTVRIVIVR